MYKWIEKYKESNHKRIEKRIAKLKAEIKQYEADYNYSPRLYYKTAIERREQEIKELEALLYPKDLLRKIEDYKEDYLVLEVKLAKVNILAENIEGADEKSRANIRRLDMMTNWYMDKIRYIEDDFIDRADKGIW